MNIMADISYFDQISHDTTPSFGAELFCLEHIAPNHSRQPVLLRLLASKQASTLHQCSESCCGMYAGRITAVTHMAGAT